MSENRNWMQKLGEQALSEHRSIELVEVEIANARWVIERGGEGRTMEHRDAEILEATNRLNSLFQELSALRAGQIVRETGAIFMPNQAEEISKVIGKYGKLPVNNMSQQNSSPRSFQSEARRIETPSTCLLISKTPQG